MDRLNVTCSFTLRFAGLDIWRVATKTQLAVAAVYVALLPRQNFLDQQFLSTANLQSTDFFILRDRQDISLFLWRDIAGWRK